MTREQKAVIIMKSIERYGAPGCVKQNTDLLLRMDWLKSRRPRERKVQKHEPKGKRHEPGSNACFQKQIYRLCQTKEKSRQLGRAERPISK